jgi:hypothetical protein
MKCQKCGAENPYPLFEAVRLPVELTLGPGTAPVLEPFWKRWACRECGRYHFPDGALYSRKALDAMRTNLGESAQNERTLSPDTTTTAHMRPVDETPEPAQNNGKPREL